MADLPPSQLSIDALNTDTPNLADLADIAQCTYMHGRLPPQSIEHRCLEYHYNKCGRYSTMHIYAWQTYPSSQLSIDAWNTTTPDLADLADIVQCTYMHGRPTPQSIEHRCLEYHYNKYGRYSTIQIYAWQTYPLQLTIDPWQTTTPNKFHDRLTPPPPPINNRSMADHYME